MKKEDISRALDEINGAYIEEYFDTKDGLAKKKRTKRLLISLAAACLAAIILGGAILPYLLGMGVPDGELVIMDASCKNSVNVGGVAAKYIGNIPSSSSAMRADPTFSTNAIVVVAKAVEMLPNVYSALVGYGEIESKDYRIFKMKVIDALGCGLTEFYYAVRSNSVIVDYLTEYEAMLISMTPMGYDFVMKNNSTDTLVSFNIMFETGSWDQLAGLIPFTSGVFDESLWQKTRWDYVSYLEHHTPDDQWSWYPVRFGSRLEEAISNIQAEWERKAEIYEDRKENYYPQRLYDLNFNSEEAKEVAELVKPFENGTFSAEIRWYPHGYYFVDYRRYIGGCPTNERIYMTVNKETGEENIIKQGIPFEDEDFEGLPDIGAYIKSLDLESLEPEHIDPTGKKLLIKSANGWYEKTEKGVYSIVKITWIYQKEDDDYIHYQDETFILLDSRGAKKVSREKLIELIGENPNIYRGEYGAEIIEPM